MVLTALGKVWINTDMSFRDCKNTLQVRNKCSVRTWFSDVWQATLIEPLGKSSYSWNNDSFQAEHFKEWMSRLNYDSTGNVRCQNLSAWANILWERLLKIRGLVCYNKVGHDRQKRKLRILPRSKISAKDV